MRSGVGPFRFGQHDRQPLELHPLLVGNGIVQGPFDISSEGSAIQFLGAARIADSVHTVLHRSLSKTVTAYDESLQNNGTEDVAMLVEHWPSPLLRLEDIFERAPSDEVLASRHNSRSYSGDGVGEHISS